jgi:hypothetical protein
VESESESESESGIDSEARCSFDVLVDTLAR